MFDLPPPDPGFEFFVASRGISKGLAQTEGPQFIPKAFVQMGPVQLGGQWKNVTSPVAEGEGAIFANASRAVGPVQLNVGITYKFQTAVRGPTDSKAWEFTGGLSGKHKRFGARLNAVYSPDDFGSTRQSLYVEAGPSLEIDKTTRLSANLGRRERKGSPDYTSFNIGATKTLFKKLALDLRYYDTAQSELGEVYRGRVIASARLTF
jgi:uncharacterized protein (TIGR02001 family)